MSNDEAKKIFSKEFTVYVVPSRIWLMRTNHNKQLTIINALIKTNFRKVERENQFDANWMLTLGFISFLFVIFIRNVHLKTLR